MLVQFASDLHLEFLPANGNLYYIAPKGHILILAGDIVPASSAGDMRKFHAFLDHYSKHYSYIIHVPGNHEYWSDTNATTMRQVDATFAHLERRFPKYRYVPRGVVRLQYREKKYKIICATLWSHIPPAEYAVVKNRMNDYDMIRVQSAGGARLLEPRDVARIHKMHLKFIMEEIASALPSENVILVTHHKPTSDLGRGVAYETDLVAQIIHAPVKLAIHGHTHVLYDKTFNRTRVVSNPRGYHGHQRTGFRPGWTINV